MTSPDGHQISEALSGLSELWRSTTGDPAVVIGVIDGPVDTGHPALAAARLSVVGDEPPRSGGRALIHGTAIASLIFGADGLGVAPGCRGVLAPIFRDEPGACSQWDLARALDRLVAAGARIINVSGGEWAPSGAAGPHLAEAVRRAVDRGVLIVAAAGNDGCACLHVPAALPGVLAVGAMTADGTPLASSNWGVPYRSGGLLAPGDGLLAAAPGGRTMVVSGTSAAAAVVSGAAALVLSLGRQRGRAQESVHLRDIFLDTADPCLDDPIICQRFLSGSLNLRGAAARVEARPRVVTMSLGDTPEALPAPDVVGDVAPVVAAPSGVQPSAAGCGCASCRAAAGADGGLVFALGQLALDLVSEARRDSIAQHMGGNPADPAALLDYLDANPWEAEAVTWTLNFDQTPVYALRPAGSFAAATYEQLRRALRDQNGGTVERVSIAGRLTGGEARMLNGQVVPVVRPEVRGFYSWNTGALVEAVVGGIGTSAEIEQRRQAVRGFLERIYHALRNPGAAPQDRAINYAATNAFQVNSVYMQVIQENMELDTVEVERSPICRPESDCWDVKVYFFYPERQVQTVRRVYRFTVDVSDVVPVMVGPVRSWFVR